MKVVFDQNTIQVFAHESETYYNAFGVHIPNPAYQKRLVSFLKIVESLPADYTFDEITSESLRNCDLLVILTRYKPFEDNELSSIIDYLKRGGNLLLMSNHSPLEADDAVLASKLGLKLTGTYWSGETGVYTKLGEEEFTDTMFSMDGDTKLREMYTNTTCRIETPVNWGQPIAYLSEKMKGRQSPELNQFQPHQKLFAVAFDGSENGDEIIKGKVVVVADSGFLGDNSANFPGYGMMDEGENRIFVKNLLTYLKD